MKRLPLQVVVIGLMVTNSFSQEIKLYNSPAYSIYSNKVVQNSFEAKALSDKHITSNYKSPSNEYLSSDISFKFSINRKDNEMPPGVDHHFIVSSAEATTPVIVFGQQLKSTETQTSTYLKPETKLTIRLDMREVLKQMNEKGFYTTFRGDKIYKEDFKAVYVAGNTAPLVWDFDNLHTKPALELKDADGDGIYETTMILNSKVDDKSTAGEWTLTKNISAFPQYSSDHTIINALYNMALEEMENAVEKDSTLRTGKEWAGVWTRDVSYSIILSMAYLQPKVAMNSLMRKVNKRKRIIQDTGTGGAWPVSTDRMIWAVAAFEIYKVTGDKDWLRQVYEIVRNSIDDDLRNIYDPVTGLAKGESSFLDWREQTYPRWMQPADIFESECLGTNAAHYQANRVLAAMCRILKQNADAIKYEAVAARIKDGINKYLWMPDKGYYGQFLYGRNFNSLSPRSEALGEALCVLFGIAGKEKESIIIRAVPQTAYGIPCIYPQIPGIPPYHNNAVWPFVQSYWLWAGAKAGNERSVEESMAAIYRPAALFLTNKENFVADNGDYSGTQINSSNMLWSLSGNISIVHKVLFGIRFNENNLSFSPFVPRAYAGKRSLNNFKYRGAVLNISMEGFGNKIKTFMVDGKVQADPQILSTLKGVHSIRIVLTSELPANSIINKVENKVTPETPLPRYDAGMLKWNAVGGGERYRVLKNGLQIFETKELMMPVNNDAFAEYQVIAVDGKGLMSFASEPVALLPDDNQQIIDAEKNHKRATYDYKGFNGTGFIELSQSVNRTLNYTIDITVPGLYAIDVRYANGNGPTNTENKCAIRNLLIDQKRVGTIVMPQRGKEEWSNWGMSNAVQATLTKGKHVLTLDLAPFNENMNGEVNQAMLDEIRITRIK